MTSLNISKDIVNCIAVEIVDVILKHLSGGLFALLIDEACDTSIKEQMTTVLRFVDETGSVIKRFVGMVHVPNTTSISLKTSLDAVFSKHKLSMTKLRGQCYDGASNMQGSYCNHYFLRMLSSIGKGQYEVAYDADSIEVQMRRWFRRALSPILANVTIDILDHLEAFEVYPFNIPDLSLGCPLVVSGRYEGKFPDTAKAKGCLPDMSNVFVDLKVQNAKEFPLDKVIDKHQIDLLTAQAWFSESKQLEEKIIKRSIQSSIPSEHTCMILVLHESDNQEAGKQKKKQEKHRQSRSKDRPIIILSHGVKLGYGDIQATIENLPSGVFGDPKPPETFFALDKARGCCSKLCDCCCCMCFIKTCSKMNDQFVIVVTQLCAALSCIACFECCSNLCCGGSD